MIYIFTGLFVILIVPFWILRNYEREFIRRATTSFKILRFVYPAGLYVFDIWLRKYGKSGRQIQWAESIYTNESPKAQLRIRGTKRVIKLWISLIAASISGLILLLSQPEGEREAISALPRPEIGETASYELEVTGIETASSEVTVTVSARQPEDEALSEVFNQAFEHIADDILGKNESLEDVRYDLELVSVTDYGIRVEWDSLSPELITSRGTIVAKAIPKEGEIVILRAGLSYGTYQAYYDLPVHLMPLEKDSAYYYSLMMNKLDERDKGTRKNDVMILPERLEGKEIQFFYQEKKQSWGILLFMVMAGILLVLADCQNMKKEYEERNQQLLRDYPSLVFKLSIMLGCGITLRGAWKRIIEGYQEQKKNGAFRYVYEEMLIVQRRMESGDGEAAAYLMFGQRCREECYLRLGTYLDQNLRQGVSGMQAMLETEMNHALEERRNLSLRLGEAMNTRLLLPMVLMLGVVIAVLMTPALLSM